MSHESITLQIDDEPQQQTNVASRPDNSRAAALVLIGCSIFQLPTWGKIDAYRVEEKGLTLF